MALKPKKAKKMIEKAMKTYAQNSSQFNQILQGQVQVQVPQGAAGSATGGGGGGAAAAAGDGSGGEGQDQNGQQQQQNQPAVNVVNYIDPNSVNKSNEEKEKKKETVSESLAKIPQNLLKKSTTDWEPLNYRNVDTSYQLTENASVKIYYSEEWEKLIYQLIEPELTKKEEEYLEELKKAFVYVFEKFSPDNVSMSQHEVIVEGAKKLAAKYGIDLTEEQMKKITYFLSRDFLGLEKIDPIMYDPYIEDVSCDGLNVPIFVNHLKYGAVEVNRKYTDNEKLDSFIVKLAQKSRQEVSLSKPILQGSLPDGSRVEAIYGKEISGKGSSFTIRKFREEPFTPIHLMDFGTMPAFIMAYLWLAVENKNSILVSGGTATGKTTILNALSLFSPPSSKIVSIEDTPEINLPHDHWLQTIAREGEGKSEVNMFELLKAALRERPDYIIVGEIRGAEASILFQGMATGHAGLGTVHAESFEGLINRMTIDPINLPPQLLTELDIALFVKQAKVQNNVVRRLSEIVEIIDYDSTQDQFQKNNFIEYNQAKDDFKISENSYIISHLIEMKGGNEDSLWKEIEKRRRILTEMHDKKIFEFQGVSDVIAAYYRDPNSIFDFIEDYLQRSESSSNNNEQQEESESSQEDNTETSGEESSDSQEETNSNEGGEK